MRTVLMIATFVTVTITIAVARTFDVPAIGSSPTVEQNVAQQEERLLGLQYVKNAFFGAVHHVKTALGLHHDEPADEHHGHPTGPHASNAPVHHPREYDASDDSSQSPHNSNVHQAHVNRRHPSQSLSSHTKETHNLKHGREAEELHGTHGGPHTVLHQPPGASSAWEDTKSESESEQEGHLGNRPTHGLHHPLGGEHPLHAEPKESDYGGSNHRPIPPSDHTGKGLFIPGHQNVGSQRQVNGFGRGRGF